MKHNKADRQISIIVPFFRQILYRRVILLLTVFLLSFLSTHTVIKRNDKNTKTLEMNCIDLEERGIGRVYNQVCGFEFFFVY
jgi:hypothetical protein